MAYGVSIGFVIGAGMAIGAVIALVLKKVKK